MATKFAEIALGIKYRKIHKDGTVSGGAMYYLADGLHQNGLVFCFRFWLFRLHLLYLVWLIPIQLH